MDRRHIPLNALRTFEAVSKHLHMGKAADELAVTHSAVSHQIKKLEEYFDVVLLERQGKKLGLTSRGRQLYDEIRKGFDLLQQATFNLDPELLSGKIRLGCTSALCSNWLIGVLASFFRQYPSINIELVEVRPLAEQLPNDVDIAICYGKPETTLPVQKMLDVSLYPVARQELFAEGTLPNSIEQLISYPLLLDSECNWEALINRFNPKLNPDQWHSIRFFDSSHAIEAARQGLGIALADPIEVAPDLARGKLVRLPGFQIDTGHGYFMVNGQPDLKRASLFANWLIEQIKGIV